jgi:hypothetical protein
MARKKEPPGPWETITTTLDGVAHEGRYRLEPGDWMTVA